ncbi:hypothetical protein GCM10011506_37470 [Marivirga lumbricoides]|uniref:Uncharacterized protein n=1 Tax=Marivirga lumbricoides TaxID=1046115 RepID=A0ABQ1MWS5_9BACT|nr:hypothetical protein GCM10011506_37470 [Marivirga lumbricoides]
MKFSKNTIVASLVILTIVAVFTFVLEGSQNNNNQVNPNLKRVFISDIVYDENNSNKYKSIIQKVLFNKESNLIELKVNDSIQFLNKSKLTELNEFDLNRSLLIKVPDTSLNMNISSIIFLNNTFHLRGAPYDDLANESFYFLDKNNRLLNKKTDTIIQNSDYALEGFYCASEDYFAYISMFGSLVFIFDMKGDFKFRFNTIDNSGVPKVIVSSRYRRRAASSMVINSSASIYQDKLVVLSNIRDDVNHKAFDVYDLKNNGKYLYSLKVKRDTLGYMATFFAMENDSLFYITFNKNIVIGKSK